jgi:hypothetical protein
MLFLTSTHARYLKHDAFMENNIEKQAIRAISRQTIVPKRLRNDGACDAL